MRRIFDSPNATERVCSRCLTAQHGVTYAVEYGTFVATARDVGRGCYMHHCCPSCLLAWIPQAIARHETLLVQPNREGA